MKNHALRIAGIATLLFSAWPCIAQSPATAEEALLTSLYRQQLAEPENQWVNDRIASELENIRKNTQEEMLQTIGAPVSEELSESDPTRAIDRQEAVVQTLKDRIAERKVDIELLEAEEQKFYLNPEPPTGSGATEQFRLTKSHAELLAKRAILKERIAALESLLAINEQRLEKLTLDQRRQQFGFLRTIATYGAVLLLIWLFERIVSTTMLTRIRKLEYRYTAIKAFTMAVYIFAALWLLSAILAKHPNIITSFAIIGAGVAIAMQDVVKDVLGWMMIRQHQLFTQGQRVTIGVETGEVVDIGMLRTRMLDVGLEGEPVLERTGKILSVPNSAVLTQSVLNHSATSDFVRAEMRISVTYESDWEKAEKILRAVLEQETAQYEEKEKRQHSDRTRMYFIPKQSRGPAVHVDLGADGIDFTLRFSVPIGERRPVVTRISREILKQFTKAGNIELAYKTTRSYSTMLPPKEELAAKANEEK